MSKEIQQILSRIGTLSAGEKAILATVVDVEGSGYRLPGAKMLIAENGYACGTVSGGCLEADVLERARRLMATGESEILTYDTTAASEDSIFSLNMGCRGIVRILIEPVTKDGRLFAAWQKAVETRERGMIATLISSESSQPVGGRIYLSGGDRFDSDGLQDVFQISPELSSRCIQFHSDRRPAGTVEVQSSAGRFEFFFENIEPPLNLFIFGAGHDAIPLAALAKELGWRVSVIDHRAAFAAKERFPGSDEIIISHAENLSECVNMDDNSVAVVMTHNYQKDLRIIRFLLSRDLHYTGVLGPKVRSEKLLEELRAGGFHADASRLEKLHAPVGLDIGADTPELIALAIAAEIKSVLAKRDGGFLRDRSGSIYERK